MRERNEAPGLHGGLCKSDGCCSAGESPASSKHERERVAHIAPSYEARGNPSAPSIFGVTAAVLDPEVENCGCDGDSDEEALLYSQPTQPSTGEYLKKQGDYSRRGPAGRRRQTMLFFQMLVVLALTLVVFLDKSRAGAVGSLLEKLGFEGVLGPGLGPKKPEAVAMGTKYLFAFGDSYTKTDTNINGAHPSPQNPIGNPSFPGVTTSGGPNWIGYLTSTYNETSILAYNFAWNGATVDANIARSPGYVLSLIDQTKEFSESVAGHPDYVKNWTKENSLFACWIGVNDVRETYARANRTLDVAAIIGRYLDMVDVWYQAGGRNFLFLNVPPFERSEQVSSKPPAEAALEASGIYLFNALLSVGVEAFKSKHQDANAMILNTTSYFNYALDHPQEYGAVNATCQGRALGDSGKCIWYDDLHPGIELHKLTAKMVGMLWRSRFFSFA